MRDVSVIYFFLRRIASHVVVICVGLTASWSFAQVPSNILGGLDPACLPQLRSAAQECRGQIKTEGQNMVDVQVAVEQCVGGKISASCKAQLDEGKKRMKVCQGVMQETYRAVAATCQDKTGAEQQECAKQIAAAELSKSPECRAALSK